MILVKHIAFLTGTRADYGKIQSLLRRLKSNNNFRITILVTGMHLLKEYGETVSQIVSDDLGEIVIIPNQFGEQHMEVSLSRTIEQISGFLETNIPDLIVVHGDRIEALAGAIVGSIRNVPVAHIEGGEVSGTIDGLIRHSVSKLSHLHFVANDSAKNRLIQLGENHKNIFEIGSPDIDVMFSQNLPTLIEVFDRYAINFEQYSILIYHPVTTETHDLERQVNELVDAVILSQKKYIVIKPNNDRGSEIIQQIFSHKLSGRNFFHIPSMRFEYFLTLMRNSEFIIGNSSAGIRESSYYGVPAINIGNRQRGRHRSPLILDVPSQSIEILNAINLANELKLEPIYGFGDGTAAEKFEAILETPDFWPIDTDKVFIDFDSRP